MHETTTEVTIRPAALSDRLAICNLLQQAWHSAGGCRWDQLDAIESGCTALLTCRGSQIAGLGLFDLRAAPVARLSAVAFADREEVGPAWAALWHAAEADLVRRGLQSVYYVGDSPWLLDVLMASGFRQTNTLVSYERTQDGYTAAGHAGVRLRSGRPGDLDAIAEIDRASFPPMWRYPRPMLEAALQPTARLTVAELERRLVGYELSTLEGSEGELVRLAVLPEHRRQGIATRLVAESLATFRRGRVRRVSLNTQSDNAAAQALYERFGFRRTGEELPVLEKALGQ
ncbi:MAG: GNAT family N-acetyltransferase [Anaerolineae bacterium]